MSHTYVMPTAYPANNYGQVPPMVGGTTAVFYKSFVFGDTGDTVIANLPAGSSVIDVAVHLSTAFDSVTSATLNVGTTADPDAYVDAFDLKGTAGTTRSNSASGTTVPIAELLKVFSSPSDVIVNIATVGTTTAGAVTVVIWYATE